MKYLNPKEFLIEICNHIKPNILRGCDIDNYQPYIYIENTDLSILVSDIVEMK